MVTFLDIFITLLINLTGFLVAVIILTASDTQYLFFLPVLVVLIINYYLKRRKRIAPYLEKEFSKLGYYAVTERPLKFSEATITIKPAVLINNIPASRYAYIRQFARVFEVIEIQSGERWELNTLVTKQWNGEKTISILKKEKLNTV